MQDGYWYEFDDERVTRVNPASAISPTDAYLLFFKRRVGPKPTA